MQVIDQPAFVLIDPKTLYLTPSEAFVHDLGLGVSVHLELFGAQNVPTIRIHADLQSEDPTSRGEPIDVDASEAQVFAWGEQIGDGLQRLLVDLAAATTIQDVERLGRAFFAKLTPAMLLALIVKTSFVHDVEFPIKLALATLAEREAA